ncbi:guanine nucleotide exchange factor synembryn-domain-containing protein [Amylocarpus encephaloides]|uniref:Guanine nucleotide exchange factor synembryn-domain-containing protein n=1 Tax=Amylocarpus encephaloides TaxID=45428 RepID=A0A9P8C0C5_9HELO|nr:guanine nucleotide exchange factor synembryn-domain-containing protein [Amylocarpus encephaloides]
MNPFRRPNSSSSSSIMSKSTPKTTPRSSASSAELTGEAKLDDLTKLMGKLKSDLQEISLLPHQRDAILEQVKVYGRDPTHADPIFTKEGIETLTRHAFNSPSQNTSRAALRCLANAMLLRAETRQIFVDLGYMSKACAKLKLDSRDDEFLVSRILFLTTYDTNIDIVNLIDEDKLAENICVNISRHGKLCQAKATKTKDPMQDMALIESLKLLFNLTHFCPDRCASFTPALHPILTVVSKVPIASQNPLEAPVAPLVNALLNLDLDNKSNVPTLFPKSSPNVYLDCFIEILDKSTKIYKDPELEQLVSPLLTLLRKMYEVGPGDAKEQMRRVILPSAVDRQQPLGRAESLASRLLRLSTNPGTPQVRETISGLQFDMSDKDARRFVQNVGYGFASGFLFQHNVPIPENALEAWSTSSSGRRNTRASQDNRNIDRAINPVTGQFLDQEEHVEVKMTQEEKEREAERLFVLFERRLVWLMLKILSPRPFRKEAFALENSPGAYKDSILRL